MMLVTCSGCGKNLKIKPELAGKRLRCPGCGQAVRPDLALPASVGGPQGAAWNKRWLWITLAVFLLLGLGGLALLWPPSPRPSPPVAQEKERGVAAKNYAQQYFQSFKGNDVMPDGWNVFSQRPEASVHVEPAGLRITLPPGGLNQMQSAGVGSHFGIKGDFEITLHYEILEDPDPTNVSKAGTRLSLSVNLDTPLLGTPQEEVAYFTRSLATKGFLTWVRNRHAPKPLQQTFPTEATTGRLRLVRSGDELSFLTSVGVDQPFQLLLTYRFGAEEVQKILICGTTGGEKAQIDLRISDLLIRADAIPGALPEEGGRGWLLAGLFVALTVGAILALGLWLRKRGSAAGQAPTDDVRFEGTWGHA
jgi:hypothetical protein